MQNWLVYTYQIPSEISNLEYWFLKLTLKILIHGPKNNGLVFNNDKLLSVLFKSRRTVYYRNYLMKSNRKSIKQKPTAKLVGITFDSNLTEIYILKSIF